MAEIMLVKTPDGLKGYTDADKAQQAKFHALCKNMEPGELIRVEYRHPRNYVFHKKFFAMLQVGFDAWEPERNRKRLKYRGVPIEKCFEQFREDVTIQAGYYEQVFDLRGRFKLQAKSISFGSMDESEFDAVYNAVASVLLEDVLLNYTRDDLEDVVERLMKFTEKNAQ